MPGIDNISVENVKITLIKSAPISTYILMSDIETLNAKGIPR